MVGTNAPRAIRHSAFGRASQADKTDERVPSDGDVASDNVQPRGSKMCSSNFRIANHASRHHTIKVAESASEYTWIAVRIRQYLHQVADVSRATLTLSD
jgi:hypothetical protein